MMPEKTLTPCVELASRLEAAKRREREARAAAVRIRREMAAADRRRETQMLCVLGRAWLALGERSPGFRETGARFVADYVTRDTDRLALAGTAWDVSGRATEADGA